MEEQKDQISSLLKKNKADHKKIAYAVWEKMNTGSEFHFALFDAVLVAAIEDCFAANTIERDFLLAAFGLTQDIWYGDIHDITDRYKIFLNKSNFISDHYKGKRKDNESSIIKALDKRVTDKIEKVARKLRTKNCVDKYVNSVKEKYGREIWGKDTPLDKTYLPKLRCIKENNPPKVNLIASIFKDSSQFAKIKAQWGMPFRCAILLLVMGLSVNKLTVGRGSTRGNIGVRTSIIQSFSLNPDSEKMTLTPSDYRIVGYSVDPDDADIGEIQATTDNVDVATIGYNGRDYIVYAAPELKGSPPYETKITLQWAMWNAETIEVKVEPEPPYVPGIVQGIYVDNSGSGILEQRGEVGE